MRSTFRLAVVASMVAWATAQSLGQYNAPMLQPCCVPAPSVVIVTVDPSAHTLASTTVAVQTAASTSAASSPSSATPIPASTIDWQPCSWGQDADLQCATIQVPLDYTLVNTKRDDGSNTFDFPLIRVPAQSATPRNQSILFNPGGPGGSGIHFLYGTWKAWVK